MLLVSIICIASYRCTHNLTPIRIGVGVRIPDIRLPSELVMLKKVNLVCVNNSRVGLTFGFRATCNLRVICTTFSIENSLKFGKPFFAPIIHGTP